MKARVRYNPVYKEFEAGCAGYFGNDFFRLDQIVQRQTEIYNLIKVERREGNLVVLEELYNATEVIRVAIVNVNPKNNEYTGA